MRLALISMTRQRQFFHNTHAHSVMSAPKEGYFLLADISGYTSFMAGTELEHSQEIMGEILRLLVGSLTRSMELAEVEGDAVFVYCPQERITRGETLLELVERTYLAFRNKRDAMVVRTTCVCRACAEISKLDLKFITHHGAYALQNVANKIKPVGSDINLSHRLLKNSIGQATGWNAYTLLTKTALDRVGLSLDGMHAGSESYEHFGEVKTFSFDLNSRYEEMKRTWRTILNSSETHDTLVVDFPVPEAVLWEWIHDPEKRNLLGEGKASWSTSSRPGGRTGPGAMNHCAHGKGTITETVLDWSPFEYFSAEYQGGPWPFVMTYELQPLKEGTRLIWKMRIVSRLPGLVLKLIARRGFGYRKFLENMKTTISEGQSTIPTTV